MDKGEWEVKKQKQKLQFLKLALETSSSRSSCSPAPIFTVRRVISLDKTRGRSSLLPVEGICLLLCHSHSSSSTCQPGQPVNLHTSQSDALNQQKVTRKSKTRFKPALPRIRSRARTSVKNGWGSNTAEVGSKAGKRGARDVPRWLRTARSIGWLARETLPYKNLWNLLLLSIGWMDHSEQEDILCVETSQRDWIARRSDSNTSFFGSHKY